MDFHLVNTSVLSVPNQSLQPLQSRSQRIGFFPLSTRQPARKKMFVWFFEQQRFSMFFCKFSECLPQAVRALSLFVFCHLHLRASFLTEYIFGVTTVFWHSERAFLLFFPLCLSSLHDLPWSLHEMLTITLRRASDLNPRKTPSRLSLAQLLVMSRQSSSLQLTVNKSESWRIKVGNWFLSIILILLCGFCRAFSNSYTSCCRRENTGIFFHLLKL